jgi:hypothetical protein
MPQNYFVNQKYLIDFIIILFNKVKMKT